MDELGAASSAARSTSPPAEHSLKSGRRRRVFGRSAEDNKDPHPNRTETVKRRIKIVRSQPPAGARKTNWRGKNDGRGDKPSDSGSPTGDGDHPRDPNAPKKRPVYDPDGKPAAERDDQSEHKGLRAKGSRARRTAEPRRQAGKRWRARPITMARKASKPPPARAMTRRSRINRTRRFRTTDRMTARRSRRFCSAREEQNGGGKEKPDQKQQQQNKSSKQDQSGQDQQSGGGKGRTEQPKRFRFAVGATRSRAAANRAAQSGSSQADNGKSDGKQDGRRAAAKRSRIKAAVVVRIRRPSPTARKANRVKKATNRPTGAARLQSSKPRRNRSRRTRTANRANRRSSRTVESTEPGRTRRPTERFEFVRRQRQWQVGSVEIRANQNRASRSPGDPQSNDSQNGDESSSDAQSDKAEGQGQAATIAARR